MPALVEAFRKIGDEYEVASTQEFSNHPLADFIRKDAPARLGQSLPVRGQGLICKGSPGQGNFATTPWLALFDPLVTTSARSGYYVVYLYSTAGELFLSLNQGTTAVRREFGSSARTVLAERASLMRARLPEFNNRAPVIEIDLGSAHQLPRDYEAGHALGFHYSKEISISEDQFLDDLGVMVAAYRSLTFRGGFDPSPETTDGDDEFSLPRSLEETRRYRMHRRIERNPKASALAKTFHGTTCQVCGFNFERAFGELGEGYIEAHHLKPLASLNEGEVVKLDVVEDFAVLCANCHRMLHRTADPSDLDTLRKLIRDSRD